MMKYFLMNMDYGKMENFILVWDLENFVVRFKKTDVMGGFEIGILVFFAIVIFALVCLFSANAYAGVISNITVSASNKTPGASGVTYTITAQFSTAVPANGEVNFWFVNSS